MSGLAVPILSEWSVIIFLQLTLVIVNKHFSGHMYSVYSFVNVNPKKGKIKV